MSEIGSQLSEIGTVDAGDRRQEVHTLADNLVPEQKTSDAPAQRESVVDEQGRIIDVVFVQNGKRASLKSVLPGTYTIEYTHYPETDRRSVSGANRLQNKVTLNEAGTPQSEREANLTLLHEAGHMVDYQTNTASYAPLEQESIHLWMVGNLLKTRRLTIENPNEFSFETEVPFERAHLDKVKPAMTSEEFQTLLHAFDQVAAQIGTITSLEELTQKISEQEETVGKLHTQLSVLQERHAWTNTLHALRRLKQQGITIFQGTKDELFAVIDRNLATYHMVYGKYLAPTERFKKRSY